jgi:hypothetical protein
MVMNHLLLDALKTAGSGGEPVPLFKSGKQPGLFTKEHAPAAEQALAEGLLEVVRTESKGKTETQWVRLTPRGEQYINQHESPRSVLEDLLAVLRTNEAGVPRWQEEGRAQLLALTRRFEELFAKQADQFAALVRRAEEALKRLTAGPAVNGTLSGWQLDLITFLDARRADAATLAMAFHHLRASHSGLTLPAFHDGLLHLRDCGTIELLVFEGNAGELMEPEYALLDEGRVYHAARRS